MTPKPSGADAVAVKLWASDRPYLLGIWCAGRRHRLGKVFSTAGSRLLCLPRCVIEEHDELIRLEAVIFDVDAAERGWWDITRCVCGTWLIHGDGVLNQLDAKMRDGEAVWSAHRGAVYGTLRRPAAPLPRKPSIRGVSFT